MVNLRRSQLDVASRQNVKFEQIYVIQSWARSYTLYIEVLLKIEFI